MRGAVREGRRRVGLQRRHLDLRDQRAARWRSPDTATGTYAVLRKPSALEMQSADSRVDLSLMRAQHEDLRARLEALGIPVFMLPSDDKSPFSCRIGRYFVGLPGAGVLAPHPDGLAPSAHRELAGILGSKKVDLPLRNVADWAPGARIDARDVLSVCGRLLVLIREGGTSEQGARVLNEIIEERWRKHNADRPTPSAGHQMLLRAIDGDQRGLRIPLRKAVCSPDGETLAVDGTNVAMVKAIEGTGLHLQKGLRVTACPPYTCELHMLETRQDESHVAPIVLMPHGFPEAAGWLTATFRDTIRLELVDWSEFLKLGVSLHDAVAHVRPIMDKQGRFTGAYVGGQHGRGAGLNYTDAEAAGFNRMYGADAYDPEDGWDPFRQPMNPYQAMAGGRMPEPPRALRVAMEREYQYHERMKEAASRIQGVMGIEQPGYRQGPREVEEPWAPGATPVFRKPMREVTERAQRTKSQEARRKQAPWMGHSAL
eukprot:TRINITY_DN70209_c0_g1_i1.p1 TRINITY_DN70209_c0_g1~~TRINITY_DN70209_c0_g1_i1.p1  ORF type:complete len:485 (+),score=110.03 TRINITY_DN70209_c0_g1_i1:80-1534(+)